jgi:HPt (histidine-containing phosphotransfer) domain-containing protein
MTQSKTPIPPIDLHEALERAMGEKEFLEMLIAEFTDGLESELEHLRAAIKQEDLATLAKHSHTLKGAAGNLSAKALATAIKRLEEAGRGGDFRKSVQLVEDVASEAVRLRAYMAQVDWSGVN